MADYTWDQIANYLTDGYWASLGQSRASFNPDRTLLSYDISQLSSEAQKIAIAAFNVWGEATGIQFQFVSSKVDPFEYVLQLDMPSVDMVRVEGNYAHLHVFIRSAARYDHYQMYLDAGTTYTFDVKPDFANLNPSLQVVGNGVSLSSNQPGGAAEHIEFKPTVSGTYELLVYGDTSGGYDFKIATLPDIVFHSSLQSYSYTQNTKDGSIITHSDVYVNDKGPASNFNGALFQSYLREIGHALGFGNAGPYSNTATYGTNNIYDNDSWKASAMSLFDQVANTTVPGDLAYLASLMPADFIAIQNLYGPKLPNAFFPGQTVWGPGGYLPRGYSLIQTKLNMAAGLVPTDPFFYNGEAFSFTIESDSGVDTIDMSLFKMRQIINLNELQYSSIAGASENVVIARGTIIENAAGGSAKDTLIGNQISNLLAGNDGDDELFGNGGDDSLQGGAGSDLLAGGEGADSLSGGDGIDTASYSRSAAAVTVNLDAGSGMGGDAQGDTYTSMENVVGSAFNDVLIASGALNKFDGGGGRDTVSYETSTDAVFVNLTLPGGQSGGNAQDDVLTSIENLIGSINGDYLVGDSIANVLSGGGGNDVLVGGLGQDTLDGGANSDTVDYEAYVNGVSINLATGAGADGDLLISIENVIGSRFGDVLTGDNGPNRMMGAAGNDLLVAGNGADTLDGGSDRDTVSYATATLGVYVNLGTGIGANGGVLVNIENILGSDFGDLLYGDAGANTINGGAGNDYIVAGNGADNLIGGADLDTVSYETATSGVFANLGTGIGANGGVLSEIENLTGSNFGDVLYGSSIGNTIKGGAGNDFIVGGAGSDALYGGADADIFRYEAAGYGGDVIVDFQDGVDKLSFATTLATSFSNFTVAGNGTTSVTLTLAGQAIVVQGAAAITLDAGDFLFVA